MLNRERCELAEKTYGLFIEFSHQFAAIFTFDLSCKKLGIDLEIDSIGTQFECLLQCRDKGQKFRFVIGGIADVLRNLGYNMASLVMKDGSDAGRPRIRHGGAVAVDC